MELGGHAPVLVFEDADLEQAADLSVVAKFRNCGQVCISPTRFFVQERVAEAFSELVVERVRRLRIGPGADPSTDVGPLANRRRLETVEQLVQDAVEKGAEVLAGGKRPPGMSRGFFYEPTLLTRVTDEMDLMRVEPFGPIMPMSTFKDLEEGIARANASDYGLAGYVFTGQTRTAFLAAEGLEVGMIGINNLVIATAEAPFGGIKRSGFGREGGPEALDSYTVVKYVNLRL
jgi:succinate-semialdehyde dehydrogenase/glutarate-semialdehyde dehydrogenase